MQAQMQAGVEQAEALSKQRDRELEMSKKRQSS